MRYWVLFLPTSPSFFGTDYYIGATVLLGRVPEQGSGSILQGISNQPIEENSI